MRAVASYLMNPAEDVVLYGDELVEGMWVLPECTAQRNSDAYSEEEQLRRERFRRVTKLRVTKRPGGEPQVTFIGVWIDRYEASHGYSPDAAWIVKRDSMPAATRAEGEAGA